MKRLYKISAVFLAVFVMLSAFGAVNAAGTATVSTTLSSASVLTGKSFTATVTLKTTSPCASFDLIFNYDASALDFVSCTSALSQSGSFSTNSTANGAVNCVYNYNGDAFTTATIKVTFTAKSAATEGKYSFTIDNVSMYDEDVTKITPTVSGTSVTIKKPVPPSTVNTLKSLTVSPKGLKPQFSPSVTSYSMEVSETTSKLTVSASPTDSKAKVSVSGASSLKYGNNTVYVTVTAESGAKKVYKISVFRNGSEPEPEPEPEKYTFQYNDVTYTQSLASSGKLSDKYVKTAFTLNKDDKEFEVPMYANEQNGLVVAFFTDSENKEKMFLYDQDNERFYSYTVIAGGYVLLPFEQEYSKDTNAKLPQSFEKDTVVIGDITACISRKVMVNTIVDDVKTQVEQKLSLIYAIDDKGDKQLFVVGKDSFEKFTWVYEQWLYQLDNKETNQPTPVPSEGGDNDNNNEYTPIQKLLYNNIIWWCVSGALLVLCIILIVILAVKSSGNKRARRYKI